MKTAGNVLPWVLLLIAIALAGLVSLNAAGQQPKQWSYSQLLTEASAHRVKTIQIDGSSGVATAKNGTTYEVTLPSDTSGLGSKLAADGVDVEYRSGGILDLLGSLLPTLVIMGGLIAVTIWLFSRMQRGQSGITAFGRSTARQVSGIRSSVRFTDVAGEEEALQELTEIVGFLRDPARFQRLGARIPKGVLMVGPPGSGKTLLAKAVAGEAGVPFFSISGSEFVEMFVGVGASRVRSLFQQAKAASPCLIFVDEIDAVGRQRGAGLGGGNDEREQTLNQLLVEMDGFDTDTHVIIIAATNRPDVLDPALLRAGRFDRRVTLDRPDVRGRLAILKVHTRDKPLAAGVDLGIVARQTPGFCGADLANVVNEAAILAARADRVAVELPDLEEAIARVIAGPERKSMRMSDEEKRTVAFHEAGHAVVMKSLPNSDRVRRVSVVSRGSALGWTLGLPDEDHYLMAEDALRDQLAGLMGGRTAEEIVFHKITSGASNDIQKATRIARQMVTQWGMSERVGTVTMGENEEVVFLGRDLGEHRNYSEELASIIDEEVKRLIEEARATARRVLTERRDALETLAGRLLVDETVEETKLDQILQQSGSLGAPVTLAG